MPQSINKKSLISIYFKLSSSENPAVMKIFKNVGNTILFIILFGCDGFVSNDAHQTLDTIAGVKDFRIKCVIRDTITSFGTSIKYKPLGMYYYEISWANKGFKRSFFDSQFCCWTEGERRGPDWDFVPRFSNESKNNIVLISTLEFSGPSNPSPLNYYALILPKNTIDSVYRINYFLDTRDDLLSYFDINYGSIFIINLVTKRKQEIIVNPGPNGYSRSPTWPFRNCKFEGAYYILEYESVAVDIKENPLIIRKSVKIEI